MLAVLLAQRAEAAILLTFKKILLKTDILQTVVTINYEQQLICS
jgi:hypothetical protein